MSLPFESQITRTCPNADSEDYQNWHKLVVAEEGFSMLNIYGRHKHGIAATAIREFADQVNRRNESGSLHPQAPISAVPRKYFRDVAESDIPMHLDGFKSCIREFIDANSRVIHARRILVDFHVSPAPVPLPYIEATELVFKENASPEKIDEIVIFT